MGLNSIYPITDDELDAAQEALNNAIQNCASLTSCVHAVLGAIAASRTSWKPVEQYPKGDNCR